MPVFRQPFAAAGGIIFQKFYQRPEIRRMILMLQMRNLMRHDIADDKFRRQRQTPAVIDIIQRGTACPAGFRILYADVMHGFADFTPAPPESDGQCAPYRSNPPARPLPSPQ